MEASDFPVTHLKQSITTMPTGVNQDADYIMGIFYQLIGILGIAGNLFVIVVMLYSKHLRKSITNLFIINQSALDFTASIFIILRAYMHSGVIHMITTAVGREIFCRIMLTHMCVWGIFVSSTYNLVAITFERYFAIVYPLKVNCRLTHKKAYILMAIVWIFGLVLNGAYSIPSAGMRNGECTVYSIWPSDQVQHGVGITLIILQFFIPLALIITANIHILIILKHSADGANDNREKKIARARMNVIKTLILVCVSFTMCWICNQVYYFMYNLGYDKIDFNSPFYHFTVIAVFCNCCINPVIYSVKYANFQKATKEMFKNLKAAVLCRQQQSFEEDSVVVSTTLRSDVSQV